MTPLLQADDLGVRYPTRRAWALREVTADIAAGERVLLAGASGSGKSTLALCLAGLVPGSVEAEVQGCVRLDGREVTDGDPAGGDVGVVFQDPTSQFTMLTVADEVAFGPENLRLDRTTMRVRVTEALEAVGLADRAGSRLDRLSGGQQQRVVLAAALALRAPVLVLDEPTAHLDPAEAERLHDHFRAVADAGTTVIVAEHRTDLVVPALADRALLLDGDGRVVLDGRVDRVLRDPVRARTWVRHHAALPTPVAFALACGHPGPTLPLSTEEAAQWLVGQPGAQARLRGLRAPEPAAPGAAVIDARSLDVRLDQPTGARSVLRGVDLHVAEGELVAVVGRSGSGKTTLLRALAGLLVPDAGVVTVDGRDLSRAGAREVARLVGLVFQNPEAGFVADTVADELAFGPRAVGWSPERTRKAVAAALQRAGLADLARANPFTLSGGQQRRLSVAAALMLRPRAILLDEPTFGQDPHTAARLSEDIAALRDEGAAVVVATHDTDLIAAHADRVVALAGGAVVFDGPAHCLFDDAGLLDATGQRMPPLWALLRRARALGADVPARVRLADLVGAPEAVA